MATLIGYGAAAINPYLMFESLDELADRSLLPRGPRSRGGREADRQGDRQGPAEDDLEDGDLDDPVLLRRADLRGGRARARADRPALHRHRVADRRRRARRALDRGAWSATSAPIRAPTATCCRSAACSSGAATASSTSGTRTRSPSSSTPSQRRQNGDCATQETYEEFARLVNEDADAQGGAARADEAAHRRAEPVPLEEVEPATEIVKRFTTGAMSLGALQPRGARDARDRDEPDRRAVEHRRGRRGPLALRRPTTTATCAARRSSRSPRAASA